MDFDFMKNITFAKELWMILLPCALMIVDFVTGFINAWMSHNIKSYVMRSGLAKKVGEVIVLILGILFSYAFKLPSYIMAFLSGYIIIMELISVLENLGKVGVPIPKFILKVLSATQDKIQNGSIEELTSKDKAADETEGEAGDG